MPLRRKIRSLTLWRPFSVDLLRIMLLRICPMLGRNVHSDSYSSSEMPWLSWKLLKKSPRTTNTPLQFAEVFLLGFSFRFRRRRRKSFSKVTFLPLQYGTPQRGRERQSVMQWSSVRNLPQSFLRKTVTFLKHPRRIRRHGSAQVRRVHRPY